METLTYDSDFSLIDLKSKLTMLLGLTSAALASEILTKGIWLTHLFPMHPFSTPWIEGSKMCSEGSKMVRWEQMG